MKLVIELRPNTRAIERHWEEFPDLDTIDHTQLYDNNKPRSLNPAAVCLVREMTAALEMDGLIEGSIDIIEVSE